MVSTILLILTQDIDFVLRVQKVQPKSVAWFNERIIGSINVGDVMLISTLRLAQLNVSKLRDLYLHQAVRGILCNLSKSIKDISMAASQKLIT
jgi:hypothetical protein